MDPRDQAIAARLNLTAQEVQAIRQAGAAHPQWEAVREAMLEASAPRRTPQAHAESHPQGRVLTIAE